MNNVSKAVLFSIVVLGIASWMGIVLQVRDEIYMFAPAIAAAVMLLLTGEAFKRAAWRELGLLRFGLR
ncbi:hypothetical protein EDM56_19225 [Brevibacillus fluminis]|uniref:Uncharacterized protein n=1 Tax=Brevibacillus fluminis TaxID=511487 RepID=A0A3M8DAP5_9BACL|nr:hypothetical protein [Brevibacillus fluminis]RNB85048.1 hypothetical protein EDM56_19225 [Brevibacillus fluminis]